MRDGCLDSGWKSYEFIEVDDSGRYMSDPVTDAFELHSAQKGEALKRMQRVEDRGWPDAEETMYVRGKAGKKKAIVRPDDEGYPEIWVLKCSPHAWRLYFYIWEKGDDKRIIYLHALFKKRIGDDEIVTAGNRHRRLCARDHCKIASLEFRD